MGRMSKHDRPLDIAGRSRLRPRSRDISGGAGTRVVLLPRYGLRAARAVVSDIVVVVPGMRSRSTAVVVPTLGMCESHRSMSISVARSMGLAWSTQGAARGRDDQRPDEQQNR